MANAFVEKTHVDGSILIYDNAGAGGANLLDENTMLPVGDFSCSIPSGFQDVVNGNAVVYGDVVHLKRRSNFQRTRRGEQQPITGSFTLHVANTTGDATLDNQTVLDLLRWNSSGSTSIDGWTPTVGANATTEVKYYGMRFRMEGTAHGDSKDHDLVFTRVRTTGVEFGEAADGNTYSVSWEAWGMTPA